MDRFQIVVGYWIYSTLWHHGGLTNRDDSRDDNKRTIPEQLRRMNFRPGIADPYRDWKYPFRRNDSMGEPGRDTASEKDEWKEAFDVYIGLVEKHEGTAAAMFECLELHQHYYIGKGSELTVQQAIQLIDSDHLGITINGSGNVRGIDAVRYGHDLMFDEDKGEIPPFLPWLFQARQFCTQFTLKLNWQQGFVEAHCTTGAKEVERWPIKLNTNALHRMACPNCGNKDEFHIAATAWFRVFDDGTDDTVDGPEWEASSEAFCINCKQYGQVEDFEIDREIFSLITTGERNSR